MRLTALPKELHFWDRFAPYYELWASNSTYHQRIVAELASMVEPGWKVLDIGAATGTLSIPLASLGCHVIALEPSEGMRTILEGKINSLRIENISIDPHKWENFLPQKGFDLVVASNSLHLTEGGIIKGAKKVFDLEPDYVCIVTELETFQVDFQRIDELGSSYEFLYIKTYETNTSFCVSEGYEYEFSQFLKEQNIIFPNRLFTPAKVSIAWWERA